MRRDGSTARDRPIVFVSRKFPPSRGGMETAAFFLHESLAEMGRVELVAFGGARRWTPIAIPLLFVRALVRTLRSGGDLLLMQDGVLAPMGVVLGFLTRRPVVVIIHGLEITHPARLHQALMHWALPRAARLIAVSGNTEALIRAAYPAADVLTVSNGVADSFSAPRDRAADRRAIAELAGLTETDAAAATVLLTVGRLVPRKGVAWFVAEVLPLLAPAERVLYLVVGVGGDRARIDSAITSSGQASVVRMLGDISTESLRAAYSTADLFIMPNVPVDNDVEGFGLVAIEASSAGTPVIAAAIDGIPDAVIPDGNGRLVPAGDAAAFAQAVREADRSEAARRRTRSFTLERFSWATSAERLRDGIADLRGDERGPRI